MEKMRILQLSLFVTFFSVGYLILNYFILSNLVGYWGGINTNYIYLVVGILSFSLPASMVIEQRASNLFTQSLYILSTTWMGIALFFLWALIIMGLIRLFVNIPLEIAGMLIIGSVAIVSAYSIINAFFVHEKSVKIPLKNLDKPLKFVQLSDVHMGSVRNSAYLDRLANKIMNLNPDAVLITGDLADGTSPINEDSFKSLKNLQMPIFFVSGNHDTYAGLDDVLRALKWAGITVLDNQMVDFKGVQIIGICYCMQRNMLGSLLGRIEYDENNPCILMHHLPSEWDSARKKGINLQLSGHTHNGQFYPFNLLVKLMFPYLGGLYKKEDDYIYVSSGTGTWGPPMRLGSRNEITVISLVPK